MARVLSSLAMGKLLKKAGAERVSQGAKRKMIEVMEDFALDLGAKANRLSKHAKRKTVKAEDIVEAARR